MGRLAPFTQGDQRARARTAIVVDHNRFSGGGWIDRESLGRLDALRSALTSSQTWLARRGGRLVGAVRCTEHDDEVRVTGLVVAPDLDAGELEGHLLRVADETSPRGIRRLRLVVGAGRSETIKRARKLGYRLAPGEPAAPGSVDVVAVTRGARDRVDTTGYTLAATVTHGGAPVFYVYTRAPVSARVLAAEDYDRRFDQEFGRIAMLRYPVIWGD